MDVPALLFVWREVRTVALTGLSLLGIVWGPLSACAAKYTPNSPEVQAAVERGIQFLESAPSTDERPGAQALVGLALLKNGATAKHPKIAQAVETIRSRVREQEAKSLGLDLYSTGLSIIFLITLDSSKYGPEIEILLAYLRAVQKPHGGWGYADKPTGDTSMTQYAVLSSWEATQAGFRVPPEMIESVTNWLLKTQDPNGGFGYQGIVAETGRVKQGKTIRHSMAAAGLGSVYICANLLGMSEKIERDEDLPRTLREVRPKATRGADAKGPVDFRKIREAQSDGNNWIRSHFEVDPPQWTYYYLYALERYYAFREAAEGERDDRWYSDAARYLIRSQAEDGSWKHRDNYQVIDTAFAVLFLLRSSKKSIERAHYFGAGVLVSGRGLPQDTSQVAVRDGKVLTRPTPENVPRAIAVLGDPAHAEHAAAAEMLAQLPAADATQLLAGHHQQLVELVESGSPAARRAAVLALAANGDLDYVPVLILALDDADPAVNRAAGEGLHQLSRKLGVFELSPQPTEAERRNLIQNWKAWYSSIRPDAQFRN